MRKLESEQTLFDALALCISLNFTHFLVTNCRSDNVAAALMKPLISFEYCLSL